MANVSFKVDTATAVNFAPNPDAGLGGGPAGVVKKDGIYKFRIEKLTPTFSEPKAGSPAKPMLELQARIVDADEAGTKLYGNVICGGEDKNKDPMVRQLFEFLNSAGVPVAVINQFRGEIDIEAIVAAYLKPGTEFYGNVRTEAKFTGTGLTSKINGYVPPENAAKAIAEGKHRWDVRVTAPAAAPSQLPAMPGGAPAAGGLPGLPGLPAGLPTMMPGAMPATLTNGAAAGGLPMGLPGLPPLPGR